jgi:DNA-binding SARP family transcriptional activator
LLLLGESVSACTLTARRVNGRVTGRSCEALWQWDSTFGCSADHPFALDGEPVPPPRGAKAWALLAYVALNRGAHSRPRLAEVLFPGAEDPLGALRWNLAALRRLLSLPESLRGDDITFDVPDGTRVDVQLLESGASAALDEPGLGHDLLEGLAFPDAPVFETWLLTERRRLAHRSSTVLREAALAALARGEYEVAAGYATRLVAIDALDEGSHALLIRSHALAGDTPAASEQLARCRTILRDELGVEPGPAVLAAAQAGDTEASVRRTVPDRPVVDARLAVAWQSFLGGAVDHAIDLGRAAVVMADACGDGPARVVTRMFLAAMLSMAVRGWDEAAAAGMEAVHLGDEFGLAAESATALGVLAGTEMMRGDYGSAIARARAGLARSDDPGARTVNLTFLAATAADTGDPRAAEYSEAAIVAATEFGDPVRIVYANAHHGRVLIMQGEAERAREFIVAAMMAAASALTLQPWVMTMLAEIDIAAGDLDAASQRAHDALALATTVGVSYQVALAHRAIALGVAVRGDTERAVAHLTRALDHAHRTTGEGYLFHWPIAFVLETLTEVTAGTDPGAAREWATRLHEHTSTLGMHSLAARARTYLDAEPQVANSA